MWQPCLLLLVYLVWPAVPPCSAATVQATAEGNLGCRSAGTPSKRTSVLWGYDGELFSETGRLLDWSFAGYAAGERPLPDVRVISDVVNDHGAKADNKTDDTAAFLRGIQAVEGRGALLIPHGVYRISAPLRLKSHTVLRGAGSSSTVLYITHSLTDLFNNSWNLYGNSDYCWAGGFIEAQPPPGALWVTSPDHERLHVVEGGRRGSTTLTVAHKKAGRALPTWFKTGAWVAIIQDPNAPELAAHLLGGLVVPGTRVLKGDQGHKLVLPLRLEQIDVETGLMRFARALPYDVRPEWGAVVVQWHTPVQEVGVEGLSIIFKDQRYNGHHKEFGYNGVYFRRTVNSWVRDVHVHNADNGVLLKFCFHNTVTGCKVTSINRQVDSDEPHGHIGMGGAGGGDNLFSDFNISTTYHHDLTTDWEHMSVFSNGTAADLRPDLHRYCPYGTLWTDIHAGRGKRLLESGGPSHSGPHGCAYTTFWNLRADGPISLVHDDPVNLSDYGPMVNMVGVRLGRGPRDEARRQAAQLRWHVEPALGQATTQVQPQDLHAAQLQRRLAATGSSQEAQAEGRASLTLASTSSATYTHAHRYHSARFDTGGVLYAAMVTERTDVARASDLRELPRCSRPPPPDAVQNGHWYLDADGHWAWEPQGCRLGRPSAAEARSCLGGQRIVMMGDSVSRYQYTSLVYFLSAGQYQDPYDTEPHSVTNFHTWQDRENVFYHGMERLVGEVSGGAAQLSCNCSTHRDAAPGKDDKFEAWRLLVGQNIGAQSAGNGKGAESDKKGSSGNKSTGADGPATQLDFFYMYRNPSFRAALLEGIAWAFNEPPPVPIAHRVPHADVRTSKSNDASPGVATAPGGSGGSSALGALYWGRTSWRAPDVLVLNAGIWWGSRAAGDTEPDLEVVLRTAFRYVRDLALKHKTRVVWKATTTNAFNNSLANALAREHGLEVLDVYSISQAANKQKLNVRWDGAHFLQVAYEQFNDLMLSMLCPAASDGSAQTAPSE